MTQNLPAESGNPEPGPDTFDFEAWLDEESTFPIFKHTAYLNQKAGAEYAMLAEELEELIASKVNLDQQIENRQKSSANSFVDATLDAMNNDREDVSEKIDALQLELGELADQIKKSAVTLTFQVKTPEELGSVTREATRQFHKENPKYKGASDDDLDYLTARTRYMLTAQIAHFCSGMKLHRDNRDVPPPTRQGADKLLTKLISSEMMRLMERMGQGLSDSRDWAEKIDAGFPGRGSDVEEVILGEADIEGGSILGSGPSDDVDRQGVGLV